MTLYKKNGLYTGSSVPAVFSEPAVFLATIEASFFFFASFLNQNSVAILTDLAMKLTCCPTSHYLVIQAETDILHSNLSLLFNFVSFWS